MALAAVGVPPSLAVPIRVACVQMRLSNSISTNVSRVVSHIASEAALGTRVVVFSECTLTGYDAAVAPTIPQSVIDGAVSQVCAACASHRVYAVVGTTWYENSIRYNAALVIGPDGTIVERYHKVHVVEPYCTNGNRLALFRIDGVPATLFICHDERYPELMRIPVLGGARIAFYISSESEAASGKNFNYRCQIVGRAVENQTWVVSCNAPVGNDYGDSHGQSRIIGPDGTTWQEAGADETVIRHTIETDLSSGTWVQAGASTPLIDQFWQEGLRVLQVQNPDQFTTVTAVPVLQPDVGAIGSSPNGTPKIACVQMRMTSEVTANAAKAVSLIQGEAGQGSRVIVFPECALTDRSPGALNALDQGKVDAAIAQVAAACQTRNVYAIVGSAYREGGKLYNGAFVIDPAGRVIRRHAQIHTDLPGTFAEGSRMSLFKIDGVYASVLVGHDIHFPELSRIAVLGGAKICFFIAYERADANRYASESQVVCRSVESQSFTVFCNAGTGNGAGDSTGHSRIVSPLGSVYAEAAETGDAAIRATVSTSGVSYDYPRAGASTPSLAAHWQEGLDVLRINNPEFYGDLVRPPMIAEITPDPGRAGARTEYVLQLSLLEPSLPWPTWTLLEGPAGARLDAGGRISGWVPGVELIGSLHTFQVSAANANGSDTESWQVRVLSRADLDGDGDVDQSDFGLFQLCVSGKGEPLQAGCNASDLTGDGDVDEDDLAVLSDSMNGPGAPPRG
jgi:predicted amidohydrolase